VLSVSAPRLLSLCLLALLLPGAGRAASPDLDRAWTALINVRPDDVLRMLGDHPSSRPEQLAWAEAKVTRQPATDANLRDAEEVLVKLAVGEDDIGAEAEYLRARLYQLHYAQPDYPKAAALFAALAARRPQSHWAQLGLVKLAMLKLYLLPDSTAPGADRLAPAESLLARIHEPLLQRDLHLQIGEAGVALQQPLARYLPHLVAADRIGGISGTSHEDLLVQVGVLSLRSGLYAQARGYFERYLREYPNNVRAFSVRAKLVEANLQMAKGGGG